MEFAASAAPDAASASEEAPPRWFDDAGWDQRPLTPDEAREDAAALERVPEAAALDSATRRRLARAKCTHGAGASDERRLKLDEALRVEARDGVARRAAVRTPERWRTSYADRCEPRSL